jgi:hypothetical protein
MTSVTVALLSALPLGSLVALIFWFVYAARYWRDGPDVDNDGASNEDKAGMAFQAIVASAAIYYLLHQHSTLMMST